jgi:mitochondrial fission protein ELM1
MVSEAVSSGGYVVVFDLPGLKLKFQEFLAIFSRKKYITLVECEDLSAVVYNIWYNKPRRAQLADRQAVSKALAGIL